MKNRGFTLLELLVVIVILGILATYVGTKIMGKPDEARQTRRGYRSRRWRTRSTCTGWTTATIRLQSRD